jgi:hypothetical protein
MKPSPILITVDSNEKGSERAKALALAVGGDPAYELEGFVDHIPVDMQFRLLKKCPSCGDGQFEGLNGVCPECHDFGAVERIVNVELKEVPDFWASKSSGHLGAQVLEIVAQGQPGFVAVFGSLQEVLAGVPKVKLGSNPSGMKKPQARSQMDIQQDISTARAFCADAMGCNVPVFFLSQNHQQSFAWILSYAKNILTGPNMASWLPRFPVEPRGYGVLCSLRGVGHTTALKLCSEFGLFNQLPWRDVSIDGLERAVGKSKAKSISDGFGIGQKH